jgi:hypothetical protein
MILSAAILKFVVQKIGETRPSSLPHGTVGYVLCFVSFLHCPLFDLSIVDVSVNLPVMSAPYVFVLLFLNQRREGGILRFMERRYVSR